MKDFTFWIGWTTAKTDAVGEIYEGPFYLGECDNKDKALDELTNYCDIENTELQYHVAEMKTAWPPKNTHTFKYEKIPATERYVEITPKKKK